MIVNAEDLILGRMATRIAKAALLGEEVYVVNCEKAIITGTPTEVAQKYKTQDARGTHAKGPFQPRHPHAFVKRVIRGMLPHRQARGREALARVKCYRGIPEQFVGKELVQFDDAHYSKIPLLKYTTVEKVSKALGVQ